MMKVVSLPEDWSKNSLEDTERKLYDLQLYTQVLLRLKVRASSVKRLHVLSSQSPGLELTPDTRSAFTRVGREARAVGAPCGLVLNAPPQSPLQAFQCNLEESLLHHPCFTNREKESYYDFYNYLLTAFSIKEEESNSED